MIRNQRFGGHRNVCILPQHYTTSKGKFIPVLN